MQKGIKILLSLFIMGIIYMIPLVSFAESDIGIYDSDIDVSMWPEIPEPYENISIKLNSYATDLNKAVIEWRSNGKVLLSGYGKTTYSFQVGAPNTSTNITITIVPTGSIDRIIKQINIKPSDMEVIWEAIDSYTPPFYKGKAFPSPEGLIRVVAMPSTNAIKSGKGNMTYQWKKDDNTIQEASGYGKDSYTFVNNILRSNENIDVSVSSVDNSYMATKNVSIPISSPNVIFYKKSPIDGILYNKALANEEFIRDTEFTLVAEPYFLSSAKENGLIKHSWVINNQKTETPSRKNEITLRPSSRGGYANIEITFENINTLLQKAVGNLKINL